MHISSKGIYGLRAMFDLAQHSGNGLVQSETIALRQGIPVSYLNQLLITLRRAGLIESLRGPQGGHRLARTTEAITLLDILSALEGPILPHPSLRDHSGPTEADDRTLVDAVWDDLRDKITNLLESHTLDELCRRKQHGEADLMYYI
jgi:Rrf2 family protein